jgi:hypothetical protein
LFFAKGVGLPKRLKRKHKDTSKTGPDGLKPPPITGSAQPIRSRPQSISLLRKQGAFVFCERREPVRSMKQKKPASKDRY